MLWLDGGGGGLCVVGVECWLLIDGGWVVNGLVCIEICRVVFFSRLFVWRSILERGGLGMVNLLENLNVYFEMLFY